LWVAGGIAIAIAFCGTYLVLVLGCATRRWLPLSLPLQLLHGALFLLATLGCVVYGPLWVTLWIFVSSATGWVYPLRAPVMRVLLLVTGAYAVLAFTTHTGMVTFLADLLPVAFIGIATAGFRYQAALVNELSQAKETVAKLAASEERLRLARDMHDLTGQSLSMITLKSDLVRKLLSRLPASRERDRAISEAADISQVSRQTLHDIREAVSGYRRPTLAVEIITARTALEAAGIGLDDDAALTLRSGAFGAEAEAALAWCLREAVTNVIRHSGAQRCQVRLIQRAGQVSLEVSDDGRGLDGITRPNAQDQDGTGLPGGSGLRGMSERLAAVGGQLSFGHARNGGGGGRGLRIRATVPQTGGPAADEHARTGEEAVPAVRVPAVPE
jgi:two-component system sensor histidine kinase DesK